MTESVLLARLEFFGSEAKPEGGVGGGTGRGGKVCFFGLGEQESSFEFRLIFVIVDIIRVL